MPNTRLEISKDFTFEAAHYFEHKPDAHPFKRMHGHSFAGTVTLAGHPNDEAGWVKDFWEIEAAVKAVIDTIDHRLLNEIEGLEKPSLEAIAAYVFDRLEPTLPGLVAVEIRRPSCGEKAVLRRG
ncbi:6-pyruvoyl trahydropterin synthase family protein [Hyphobacterium marinum]|uniref:6-carboxy-5,6,7,8-tetrahydropterin synthase n=1 Tax=Hyphobacterium marinum TaxID=3116574 RepID=A0ABU7M0S7_9PROT|nr:6-carboxytetrahydropterin synthase [Hyphobacterium sp. Y6023]MEE2567419.1 6-carboxytetrahydropterin synthase [Hyphobacterium sp. Y6023]